jgi:hypothetical protein
MQALFTFCAPQAILMRRSTVLSLPLQLFVPFINYPKNYRRKYFAVNERNCNISSCSKNTDADIICSQFSCQPKQFINLLRSDLFVCTENKKKKIFFSKVKIKGNIFHKNIFENKLRHFLNDHCYFHYVNMLVLK